MEAFDATPNMRISNPRGQIFTIDLIIGMLIFLSALTAVVLFLPRERPPFTDDAQRVEFLMTNGIPHDWNATTVDVPGFLTDGQWNYSKIDAFNAFTAQEQKRLLGIRSDYTIRFFENGSQLDHCTSCGSAPASYDNLLPITRWASNNGTILSMEVRLYS